MLFLVATVVVLVVVDEDEDERMIFAVVLGPMVVVQRASVGGGGGNLVVVEFDEWILHSRKSNRYKISSERKDTPTTKNSENITNHKYLPK